MSRSGAFLVVIPARYASTRLHAKPLADIAGKPMVVRVAERARESGAKAVWVATDSQAASDNRFEDDIRAFEAHGFVWGGKWLFFDTIHFEYRPELLTLIFLNSSARF